MTSPTTTGLVFLISSLGIGICGLKFLSSLRNQGRHNPQRKLGPLISALFLTTALQHGAIGIGGLIFAKDAETLYGVFLVNNIFITLSAAIAAYTISFIFFPRISPWFGVYVALALGGIVIFQTISLHPNPFINSTNSIDWNLPYNLSINLYYLLLIQIGSTFFIFAKLLTSSKDIVVRIISLAITILALGGIINVFLLFGMPDDAIYQKNLKTFDLVVVSIGILFIIVFALVPLISEFIYSHKKKRRSNKTNSVPK